MKGGKNKLSKPRRGKPSNVRRNTEDSGKKWQTRQQEGVNVQKLLGGKGQSLNAPSNDLESLRSSMVVATMTKVLPIEATVPNKAIQNLSLGIVLKALKSGLAANIRGMSTNPFYMYRYLTDTFAAAMTGTVPKLQQAPVWFWELVYAIRKKQVSFKLSDVNYSWIFQSTISDEVPIPMGIGSQAYSVVLSQDSLPGQVLGFSLLAPTVVPYTQVLGEEAIGNLWAYCVGPAVMTKLVGDLGEKAYMYRDSSAFAVVYPELGDSFETSGGLKITVYSERQIDSPLMAKFSTYQPAGTAVWRGWQKAAATGGSTCLIGPTLMNMSTIEEVRSKNSPIIKYYNFDEFYEVLSLALATSCGSTLHNQGTVLRQCPLSPIQVMLLLRQTMIPLFSNEMCQDLRVTETSSEQFLPFTVGQNGVSMGTNMLLPTCLAENIRAAKSFSNRLQKNNPRSIIHVHSVLGRPSKRPQLGNYTVEGQSFSTVYAEDGRNQLVSLIDCSSIDQNQIVYLDLTRNEIKILEASWNTWIQTLATNLSPLVAVGQTDGISLLKTGTLTNFQGQGEPPSQPQGQLLDKKLHKQASQSRIIDIPGLKRTEMGVSAPVPGTGYFIAVTDRFTTSLQIVSAPAWKYLSLWILPITVADPASVEEQSIQGWSAFFAEAYRIPRSTAGGLGSINPNDAQRNPSAYDRHVSMSQIDVKAIAQDGLTEMISELVEIDRKSVV